MKSCVFNVRFNKLSVASAVLRSGSHFNDAANLQPLNGFSTSDLYVDCLLTKEMTLQAKVNNLTNKPFKNALGYNKSGRALYLNLR